MTDSIVERVARAIFEVWAKDAGLPEDDRNWSEVVRVNHSIVALAQLEARAAIEAMREPTPAMTYCGWDHLGVNTKPENAAAVWRAMLDAALRVQP